ncbi:hypothetical protein GHNINEIG_01962 [Hydrogenovibrio crunogenus]|uniref:Uncharacterized protein n=1 Tax=Hydrogenovibrio crunogenus TaxID=39765 RepID=A0A4V1C922_9GAMM|nr:hypothetical protein [Hydrogenovibrio crunogenus]QBZ83894.1 hypothetical protein GHNINEIG_01962 [Hydrogenovibrio crunogenus]
MPGRNHSVEAGFLDALPNSLRPAAADLLHYYRLSQLIIMRKEGVDDDLKKRFDLKTMHWLQVLDAVILTKVSYFDVTTQMTPKHINKLLEITAFALHEPDATLSELIKRVEKDYVFFADWLKQVHEVRMEFVKHAKSKGLI